MVRISHLDDAFLEVFELQATEPSRRPIRITAAKRKGEMKISKIKKMKNAQHLRIQSNKKSYCVGRESNPGQLLGRQLCSPLYHRRFDVGIELTNNVDF